jgi:hypothetical protein
MGGLMALNVDIMSLCELVRNGPNKRLKSLSLVNWLQYNRRMSVILPTSICGITRGSEVKTVRRFTLSEICDMDQSPLPFEMFKGKTYNKIGANTVH